MRWFGGCIHDGTSHAAYLPLGDIRLHWRAPFPMWTVGPWEPTGFTCGGTRRHDAVVVGSHRVTASALATWLDRGADADPPPWPGTYTVVVADVSGVTLFADPVHAAPLYYVRVPGAFVWGSSSRALAGLVNGGIDPAWLAGMLLDPGGFRAGERSAFRGVQAVPPGWRVHLSPGRAPRSRPWWRAPRVRAVSDPEAVRGFRAALQDATDVRLSTTARLSTDLSGGLDSTVLFLMAAEAKTSRHELTALTVHPADVDRGGDLDYARTVADRYPSAEHLILPLSGETDPYTALDRLTPTDEPAPTSLTAARHRIAYEHVAARGSTRHMTGDGGDALLMVSPEHTLGLLRDGHVLRALRDLHGWAKLNRSSPWRLLAGAVKKPQAPKQRPWATDKACKLAQEGKRNRAEPRAVEELTLTDVRGIARTAHADAQLAENHGIHLESPFLDRCVVEAALRFHPLDRGSPWSYKPQIISAAVDLLPAAVADRCRKGGTDADHYRGLRRNFGRVAGLLDGWLADHGLIDPEHLRTHLAAARSGQPMDFGAVEPVIAAELWARAIEDGDPVSWTRSPGNTKAGRCPAS